MEKTKGKNKMVDLNKLCAKYDIDKCILLSSRRDSETVNKRILIAKELRNQGLKLTEIGKLMNRHHTSIMNLLEKLEKD